MSKLKYLFLLTTLSLGTAFAANAQSTTITYPNGQTKNFDCTTLKVQNGKLLMTCEGAQEWDVNGQNVCQLSNISSSNYPEIFKAAWFHGALQHNDGKAYLGKKLLQSGKSEAEVKQILGPNWNQETAVERANGPSLLQVYEGCKEELGLN